MNWEKSKALTPLKKSPQHPDALHNMGTKMNPKPLYIRAEWDGEAHVWVATSDDVPGLATEASTLEKLIKKLKLMIPELIELNGGAQGRQETSFEVLSRRFEPLPLVHA